MVIILPSDQARLHSGSNVGPTPDGLLVNSHLARNEVRVTNIIELFEGKFNVNFLESLAAAVLCHLTRKDTHVVNDVFGENLERLFYLVVKHILIRNFRADILNTQGG